MLGIDIDPRTRTKCFLLGLLVCRVGYGELAIEDEMGGQAVVRVRRVMCVAVKVVSVCAEM